MTKWLFRAIGAAVIDAITYGALGAVLQYGSWRWTFINAQFEHGPYPSYLGDFGRTFHLSVSFFAAVLYLTTGGNIWYWIIVILAVILMWARLI